MISKRRIIVEKNDVEVTKDYLVRNRWNVLQPDTIIEEFEKTFDDMYIKLKISPNYNKTKRLELIMHLNSKSQNYIDLWGINQFENSNYRINFINVHLLNEKKIFEDFLERKQYMTFFDNSIKLC